MIKILFISTYFLPYLSGMTVYPYRLFKYLTTKKYRVQVMTFRHAKNLASKEAMGRIDIERADYWFKISKGFFAPFFLWQTLRHIKNTDIVFLNQPTIEGLGVTAVARILGKKVIVLYQCRLDLGKGFFVRLLGFSVNALVFCQLFYCHKIVVHSEDYAANVGLLVFHRKLVYIMPSAARHRVDRDFYQKLKKLKQDCVWIGYCGRISREKGIEYLIEAYTLIKVHISSVVLVFAGPYGGEVAGEQSYFKKIKKQLEGKNVFHHFFGRLRDDELGSFYQAIDVLVLPSINSTEAFGITQVEAMLQGIPVVATDLPGVRVPIKITRMGRIVGPKDARALSRAIVEVIQNRAWYASRQFILTAREIFNDQDCFTKWETLLKRIKAERSAKI